MLNTANADTNARSIGVVREGGVLVSIVGPAGRGRLRRREDPLCAAGSRVPARSNADLLARVGELADAGKFKVFVEESYSLADASRAWDKSRAGHTRGKLIIKVSEGPTMKHQ